MIIGIPRERKDGEFRVAMVPAGVMAFRQAGHQVFVEQGAGLGAGFTDAEYRKVGARIVKRARQVWDDATLILKVKEPIPAEYPCFHDGLIVFSFLHLAPNPALTKALLTSKVLAIACETVGHTNGGLPLLEPMSEIGGRMAALVGAFYQARPNGGRGVLVAGMPGVLPAHVAIVGGGIVGENAAKVAAGMGARVTILELKPERMRYLDEIMPENVSTLMSNPVNIAETVAMADIVIGAVLIPGALAPRLVSRRMLKTMKPGSVIVDVAVDQGGCCETTRPTTHSNPTYEVNGVLHYCVANMPGAYAHTSTLALGNATLPYAVRLATLGLRQAMVTDQALANGINTRDGFVTCAAVAEAHGLPFHPLRDLLS